VRCDLNYATYDWSVFINYKGEALTLDFIKGLKSHVAQYSQFMFI